MYTHHELYSSQAQNTACKHALSRSDEDNPFRFSARGIADMHNIVSEIERKTHFASGCGMMMAKGKMDGETQYGLTTVLNKFPFMRKVHEHFLTEYVVHNNKNMVVTSIEWLVPTGQQGTVDEAIVLDMLDDESFEYIISNNHIKCQTITITWAFVMVIRVN
jgi:hypothetical protein